MSRKPLKKSDRCRPWRSGERRSARAMRVRMTRHLVVCEGTRTEPRYFNGLKAALGEVDGQKVEVKVIGSGMHTTDLLELAQEWCRKSADTFDHVWIVYDKDYFPADEFDLVEKKCRTVQGPSTFHALWSNPCFEIWLLLHFGYTTAEMNPAECSRALNDAFERNLGCEYAKSLEGVFGVLGVRRADAIENADRLGEHHLSIGNTLPSSQNPGTKVGDIFDEVGPYLEGDK